MTHRGDLKCFSTKNSLTCTKMSVGCFDNIKQNWFPILLNILFLITIAIHGVVYSTKLPERVAYHYDAYGKPDQFTATRTFIAIYWAAAILSTLGCTILSIIFATNCCAVNCTSPEEASYPPAARRYLRLIVAGWALWLNLCVLGLVFTVFAVLLQNAVHSFDSATTFGVYLPFFVFCALLVVIIFWMFKRIQSAKKLIYSGFFNEHDADHPHLDSHEDEMIESKKLD